jgi:phenylalanyl-tRNA synthetase alpha chain
MDGLNNLKSDWLGRIGAASDEASLEELRVAALGKKGEISLKMRELGQMSPEERQVAGPALNALKDEVNAAITAKKARWPMPRSTNVCARSGWTSRCPRGTGGWARSTR